MEGWRKKLVLSGVGVVAVALTALSVAVHYSSMGVGTHGRAADLYLRIIHEEGEDLQAAQKGLRLLGADAMPTITNYLAYKDSGFRAMARALLKKQSLIKFEIYNKYDYRAMVRKGIHILGSNAAPALVEVFRDQPITYVGEDNLAYLATTCLVKLGSPSIPALVTGLTNDNANVRALSALAIAASSDVQHWSSVTNLVTCVDDSNADVRAAAVFALGKVLEEPEATVPALAKGLGDTNSAVRFHAIHSLWAFGVHSQPAIPAIEKAVLMETSHPDAGFDQWELGPKSRDMIMDALTNALETIRYHVETPN